MIHVVGTLGTLLVLGAYFLVSTGRVRSASLRFQGANLSGALLLAVYGVVLGAWASVALNLVWAAIAAAAVVRGRRAERGPAA